MAKRFIFNEQKFDSLWQVRQAIANAQRIAFGDWTDELKAEFGVVEEEYNPEDEMTDEQLATAKRRERDVRLKATDVYLLADYPDMTAEALSEVKAYRQALRDVPKQTGFPRQIEWPALPSCIS